MEPVLAFTTLHQFITSGGTIDVGRIDYIDCAAVASDTQTLWVLLVRREGEALHELLRRLNDTLERCLARNESVDELVGVISISPALMVS
jgi:hypothetical protein